MPIIVITASAFDFDVARAMKAGCDAHLSKPIKRNDLLRVLDDQLAASATDSNRGEVDRSKSATKPQPADLAVLRSYFEVTMKCKSVGAILYS